MQELFIMRILPILLCLSLITKAQTTTFFNLDTITVNNQIGVFVSDFNSDLLPDSVEIRYNCNPYSQASMEKTYILKYDTLWFNATGRLNIQCTGFLEGDPRAYSGSNLVLHLSGDPFCVLDEQTLYVNTNAYKTTLTVIQGGFQYYHYQYSSSSVFAVQKQLQPNHSYLFIFTSWYHNQCKPFFIQKYWVYK